MSILYHERRTGSFHCQIQQYGKLWEPIDIVSMINVIAFDHSASTHINSDTCNTNPLLHNLQPNDKLYAAASMQFAAADTEEHRVICVRACRLTLVNDTILNILELCFRPDSIVSFATTQAAEDVSRLFVSSDFC